METRTVEITRILNPTSIDLGEYVINPYKGCAYSCLYCYVRFNKVTQKDEREWGSYLDVRINAPELLEKELKAKKPKRVLLGSTTECFQPHEEKFKLTRRILEILNKNGVYYSILTRSPLVSEYMPLLKAKYCEKVYFTINDYKTPLKALLEPKSPSFEARAGTIDKLLAENIPVIPYFSPLLPCLSDFRNTFARFPKAPRIEFEGLNFNLGNIDRIIEAIESKDPQTGQQYRKMSRDRSFYDKVWSSIKKQIIRESIRYKKNHNIYIHKHTGYFQNKYRPGAAT